MTEITHDQALSLVRGMNALSGYPKYPEAESRIASTMMDCCISLEHAQAAVDEFQREFPTPAALITVAVRLRKQYEPVDPDALTQEEQWRQESGPPEPEWTAQFLRKLPLVGSKDVRFKSELDAMHRQAIKDMLYHTEGGGCSDRGPTGFWRDARAFDLKNFPELVEEIRNEIRGLV